MKKNISRVGVPMVMLLVAAAVIAGEEPAVDTVSGEASAWNAETRTLSAPGKENVVDSIVLPRQD